ncbi:response regulator [Paraburkholderia bryophila]|uniref:response regulator n=1 Tax=Paraburkholderia bryophila TaxID=420952 RepID=UPI00234B2AFD|nr:response regulator [Paraburkholderia bryophila]WCM22573.1 response regulator [Paraburkholderia bryophila]
MTRRPPHDHEIQFGLWNRKRAAHADARKTVVVAHASTAVGEATALLLSLEGFSAVHTRDVDCIETMLRYWKPEAIFVDTRLGRLSDFRFVRAAAGNPTFRSTLIFAMTSAVSDESAETMKEIGFDGLCRKPCPVWVLAEILKARVPR